MGTFRRRLAYAALALAACPAVAAAQQGYPPGPSPQAQPYPQGQNQGQSPYGQPQPYPQQPYPQGQNPYTAGQTPPPYPPGQPGGGGYPPPPGGYPAPAGYPQNAPPAAGICGRLEAQLAAIDRGAADPARAERTRRIEDALNRQQADLDRVQAQWQRLGCQPVNLFSIFSNQSPQCGPLGSHISSLHAAIDQTTGDLERSRHSEDDDVQRQSVIAVLAQNNCGPQYHAARPKGLLETLFGGDANPDGPLLPGMFDPNQIQGGGFRTVCVRTCDGYYFPISFSTSQARFPDDEQTCQKLCPAAEAVLYSHRNPGEDVAQAVSSSGRVYKDLPNAFRYRRELVPACSCKQPGQTWAEALGANKDRDVLEPGDVIVDEGRSKAMSQPRGENGSRPRQGKGAEATPPDAAAAPAPGTAATQGTTTPGTRRPVRTVGPSFAPQQ